MRAGLVLVLSLSSGCGRIAFDPGTGTSSADGGPLSDDGSPLDCPNIGDVCADGTIFAGLTPDGNRRLFTQAATVYVGPWSLNGGAVMDVATGLISRVTGAFNTTELSLGGTWQDADAGTAGIQRHGAANYCTDLTVNGRTDWYLPALDELRVLHANRVAIGILEMGEVWSSTEDTSCPDGCALPLDFGDGSVIHFRNKQDWRGARCVRK